MAPRSQPGDHLYEGLLRHRCAASGWPIYTASNVKKNRAARAGHRRIRIVPDLDQPVIREIARAHFFVRIIVGRIFRINHDMAIIVRRSRVIAPDVCFSHLVIWIIGAWRQIRVVPEDLADLEDSRRRSSIAFFLSKARLVLSSEARSPGNSIFAKQNRERSTYRLPISATRSLK
jgi:hypothetical protein